MVSFRTQGISLTAPARFVHLYVARDYEPLLVGWLQQNLVQGSTVIDVGAHIGYLSIVMSRAVGTTGRVLALEPAPENLSFLERNLAANRVGNVKVIAAGASNQTGRRSFHLTGSSDSHGFYDHPLTATSETIEVETFRLDDLVTGAVELVKIDVEGAEIDVLEGMPRLLSERLDRLVVEWTPACQRAAGRDVGDLPRMLQSHGFSLTVLDDIRHRVRTVREVIDLLERRELEASWYANIIAER